MSTLIVLWVEDEGLDVENDARYNGTATQVGSQFVVIAILLNCTHF